MLKRSQCQDSRHELELSQAKRMFGNPPYAISYLKQFSSRNTHRL